MPQIKAQDEDEYSDSVLKQEAEYLPEETYYDSTQAFTDKQAEHKRLSPADLRRLDSIKLAKYLEQRAFGYAKPKPKKEEAPKDNALARWLRNLFKGIHLDKVEKFLMYALAAFAFVLLVWGVVKFDLLNLLAQKPTPIEQQIVSELMEDISDKDFSPQIQAAIRAGDFRMAIRWMYIEILQTLHHRNLIAWAVYKTNDDYAKELRQMPFHKEFMAVSLVYEKVFYGNHQLGEADFEQARQGFAHFLQQLPKQATQIAAR